MSNHKIVGKLMTKYIRKKVEKVTYQKLNPALVSIVISRFSPMRKKKDTKHKTKWRQLID